LKSLQDRSVHDIIVVKEVQELKNRYSKADGEKVLCKRKFHPPVISVILAVRRCVV
jgi:hypothetical protein